MASQAQAARKENGNRNEGQERIYTEEDYAKIPEGIRVELIDGALYDRETGERVELEDCMKEPFSYELPPEKHEGKVYTEEDYYNLPEGVRMELIDGVLYDMASPSTAHQEVASFLNAKIWNYIDEHKGTCKVYPAPYDVKLFPDDDKTVVEPDISVICDRSKITEKRCIGAPDWVIEIVSPNYIKRDYLEKLNLYQRAKVREYWIVNPMDKTITVYNLEDKKFGISQYDFQDKVKAGIYPDLWIDFSLLTDV